MYQRHHHNRGLQGAARAAAPCGPGICTATRGWAGTLLARDQPMILEQGRTKEGGQSPGKHALTRHV